MGKDHHQRFLIADRSFLAVIKKDIHQLAADAGFTAAQLAGIDIVIAEIGSNILKHAGSGELLVKVHEDAGIDVIGIDNGPGMADAARMMEDGVSTTNTLGGGLGAIKRLSDHFQLYSQKDWGTIVFSRIRLKKKGRHPEKKEPPPSIDTYALLVPYPGEQVCGDGFICLKRPDSLRLFLGDGLGHGIEANRAVNEAIGSFKNCRSAQPAEIIRWLHNDVKKTRGLVGTAAIYYPDRYQWHACGVGNISTRIQRGALNKTYMSYNGIIGHSIPRTMNDQVFEVMRGQYLIMSSDGLRTSWDMNKYPSIFRYGPAVIAAALYKDQARHTDDTSVVVVRMN